MTEPFPERDENMGPNDDRMIGIRQNTGASDLAQLLIRGGVAVNTDRDASRGYHRKMALTVDDLQTLAEMCLDAAEWLMDEEET